MRKTFFTAAALLLASAGVAAAQSSATQQVNTEVPAVNEISVAAASVDLVVATPTAGQPLATTTTSSSYAITTNQTAMKIVASLDADMASGLTLVATMVAPTVGTSAGPKALSATTPEDMVTGIGQVNESLLDITYELSATLQAAAGTDSRTVTFTVVAGA